MSEAENNVLTNLPDCPIMHTSSTNIFLLQAGLVLNHQRPMVGFRGPLYETPSSASAGLVPWLTMLIQIPDLGVVVAGCQRGRAGVFKLYQIEGSTDTSAAAAAGCAAAPTYANRGLLEAGTMHDKGTTTTPTRCVFRLHHILPTLEQEETSQRPMYRGLVGIAAAPLQGVKSYGGQRSRWRLILTYSDCTLLSYELRRSDAGIEVDSLII